jgi:hypothetical protein
MGEGRGGWGYRYMTDQIYSLLSRSVDYDFPTIFFLSHNITIIITKNTYIYFFARILHMDPVNDIGGRYHTVT